MTTSDLLLFTGIVIFAVTLFLITRRLATLPDWPARVARSHATLYSRLAENGYLVGANLLAARRTKDERGQHIKAAALAMVRFGLVVLPALLAASLIPGTEVPGDETAIAAGVIAWSVIVELPGQLYRVDPKVRGAEALPVLGLVFVVVVLDALVCAVAISDVLTGELLMSASAGAALVAIGDLISALLGLAAATGPPGSSKGGELSPLERSDDGEGAARG